MTNFCGQAATELAIFGAIVIFLLGAIIRSAVSSGQGQDASIKAMRNALALSSKSTPGDTSRSNASILYVEDRLSPDFGKFGSVERAPFVAQGSGTMTNTAMYPLDPDELQDPRHIPVMDMFINGKHFVFSTARLVYKRFSVSGGGPTHSAKAGNVETDTVSVTCNRGGDSISCKATPGAPVAGHLPQYGGWDFSCKSGAGCPIFFQTVVNMQDTSSTTSSSASSSAKQEALEKKFCTSNCPGLLSARERFDLRHDDDPSNDPPASLYADMAWQWRGVQAIKGNADKDKALYIDLNTGAYASFDVDGDGQEETIYQVGYNSNGIAIGAVVFDSQEGDLDLGGEDAASGKVGLSNDVKIVTGPAAGTEKGNYLLMQQGKDWGLDGKFVRSISRKDQVDLVERKIQLSNDTGRMCAPVNPANPFGEKIGGDVEVCGDCFSVNNFARTCFDRGSKILYVRSRLLDKHGHFWKTDASGQLRLGR